MRHTTGLAVLGFLGSFTASGCYDAKEVQAFIRHPRSPVAAAVYRVYPPDTISIASLHVPEIDGVAQQVRPDGKINLLLLGEVFVAGKTPKEIEQELRSAAKDYYEQVDATVQVTGYNSQSFYIFGQVSSPGPMPWTGRDTLLDVLARAQPNDRAWWQRIIVVRGDEPQVGGYGGPATRPAPTTASGATTAPPPTTGPTSLSMYAKLKYRATGVRSETKERPRRKMTVNLMAMVTSGDMSNNILLMPNDVIYVQPDPLARIGLAIQAVIFPLRTATDGLSDYRQLLNDLRWIEDGMPRDVGAGRSTLISR